MDHAPELLAVMEPLRSFVGTWRGSGDGVYPTIDPFAYREEVQFWQVGKPFLGYQQRTRDAGTDLPLHTESGFWRIVGPGRVEGVIAHPTGLSEVLTGTIDAGTIHVTTDTVSLTPTAKEVTRVERRMTVSGDELTYEVHMAAVGQPHQLHLTATLRRVLPD